MIGCRCLPFLGTFSQDVIFTDLYLFYCVLLCIAAEHNLRYMAQKQACGAQSADPAILQVFCLWFYVPDDLQVMLS